MSFGDWGTETVDADIMFLVIKKKKKEKRLLCFEK